MNRPMTYREYIELLDYALDLLSEFEQQVDILCTSLATRKPEINNES